jgi:hypothetical protein
LHSALQQQQEYTYTTSSSAAVGSAKLADDVQVLLRDAVLACTQLCSNSRNNSKNTHIDSSGGST